MLSAGKPASARSARNGPLQQIPRLDAARLVVAYAGIDDDAPPARLDDEAVDRTEQAAVLVREMRPEPGVALHQFGRGLGEHEGAEGKRRPAQFGDARDLDFTDDLPTQEFFLPMFDLRAPDRSIVSDRLQAGCDQPGVA